VEEDASWLLIIDKMTSFENTFLKFRLGYKSTWFIHSQELSADRLSRNPAIGFSL